MEWTRQSRCWIVAAQENRTEHSVRRAKEEICYLSSMMHGPFNYCVSQLKDLYANALKQKTV